jgi:hypothetical protein
MSKRRAIKPPATEPAIVAVDVPGDGGSATGAVESAADDVLLVNILDVASLVVRCIVVVPRSAVAVVVDVPGFLDVAGVVDTDDIEIVVVPALKHGTDDVKFDAGNCPGSMQHDDALKLSSWQTTTGLPALNKSREQSALHQFERVECPINVVRKGPSPNSGNASRQEIIVGGSVYRP